MNQNRQLDFSDERSNIAAKIAEIHSNRTPLSLLLDGITDVRNIGMLLRLADAARLQTVYFYNCKPSIAKKMATARQVLPYLQLVFIETEAELLLLQQKNTFVALEKTTQSVPYNLYDFQKNTILILGAENSGVSQDLLDLAVATLHLPMLGINTSMNVVCAASIAVYQSLTFF
ncbi:MAG: hypothetical protein RI894_1282 [Bacteroidota bacterium]|jgi:23S rRNA (guanosine2251-2'-O)-methyltransferase